MTTLVRQHPDPRGEQALDDGVQSPESSTDRGGRDVLRRDILMEKIEDSRQTGDVTGHVRQATSSRSLVAMSRNGVADVLDGEIGKLELVAIGIQHLAVHFPQIDLVGRAERRQRCGRRRLARGVVGRSGHRVGGRRRGGVHRIHSLQSDTAVHDCR